MSKVNYAIVKAGGSQVKVQEGRSVLLDVRPAEDGRLELPVVAVRMEDGFRVGSPFIEGAAAVGVVEAEVKGPKVRIVKFRRRKGYLLRKGHRQKYVRVRIEKIVLGSDEEA